MPTTEETGELVKSLKSQCDKYKNEGAGKQNVFIFEPRYSVVP